MESRWAENILRTCMGLVRGEHLLVLVDPPLGGAGETLRTAARLLGAGSTAVQWVEVAAKGPHLVDASRLIHEVERADVIVSLFSWVDLASESPLLRAAKDRFRSSGQGRWGSGFFITQALLEGALSADYRSVSRTVKEIHERLSGVQQVRITAANGTDLTLSIEGRSLHQETGLLRAPGAYCNLPAGEVFVAPIEESAEGTLVVDLSIGDIPMARPVLFRFHSGRTEVVGDDHIEARLRQRLGDDPWAWTIGELGIGANRFMVPQGWAPIDEKVLGTAHIALGSNRSFGGRNAAETHYDLVFRPERIYLDGSLLALVHKM
jgi:leucyl aminopeptidase (aminopeptidase T)